MSDTDKRTRIAVELPLPMDVASTVMNLIGTAYPSAVIDTSRGHRGQMVMLIDPAERKRLPGKKRVADHVKDYQSDEPIEDANVTGFESDSEGHVWLKTAPSEEVSAFLSALMVRALEGAGDNYLEWAVRDREDPAKLYVGSVARSKGQTPHALRTKAEAKLDQVRALCDEHEAGELADLEPKPIDVDELQAILAS